MKIGITGPADISNVDRAVRAEALGYDTISFSDSPLGFSELFSTMSVVASRTNRIEIGAMVAVAGIRLAPVAAAGFATVNQLAPGRVFASFGTGTTAYRFMGHRSPVTQADFAEYLRVVRGLLTGEQVDFEFNGLTTPIAFHNPDRGFVNVVDQVPIYLAAHGPRGQRLAGQMADGVVEGWGRLPDLPELTNNLRTGAARSGRSLDNFAIFNPANLIVIDPGEDRFSDRVMEEAGSFACIVLHEIYQKFGRERADEVPPFVAPIWDDYCSMMEAWEDRRTFHFRSFAGHQLFIHPDERRFVTPAVVGALNSIGTPDETLETIREWEAAGITHINLSAAAHVIDDKMDRFSRLVLARL